MAREGSFGFASRIREAFEARGFRVEFKVDTPRERLKSATRNGYTLFEMKDPFHERALSIRRAYYYPFWRIEKSAARWEFEVAQKAFDSAVIDTGLAEDWANRWGRYQFRKGPSEASYEPLIYVPLQGVLLKRRSFQSMSPVEMIAEVQARAGDRRILLGLHPGETYSDEEHAALETISAHDPRVTIQKGGMEGALKTCELVVAQNSTAALSGYFFRKPAILFAKSDFHHQMPSVLKLGVDDAWRAAVENRPAYAQYLYWFIQLNAIKADEPDADTRIIETCRRRGWNID